MGQSRAHRFGQTRAAHQRVRRRRSHLAGTGGRAVFHFLREGCAIRSRSLVRAEAVGHVAIRNSESLRGPGSFPVGLRPDKPLRRRLQCPRGQGDPSPHARGRLAPAGRAPRGRRRTRCLRIPQHPDEHWRCGMEQGNRTALALGVGHVQFIAIDDDRGTHQGRAGKRARCEGDIRLLRQGAGGAPCRP